MYFVLYHKNVYKSSKINAYKCYRTIRSLANCYMYDSALIINDMYCE